MKRIIKFSLFLAAALFLAACGKSKKAETVEHHPDDKVVIAYVTSWSKKIPNPKYLTHINYAFGHVDTTTIAGVMIDKPERLKKIVSLKKKAPYLKVLLSIGGWGSGNFSEMAADESKRKGFAMDCDRVVKEFGLDGIDIDWEYPTQSTAGISSLPEDTENYTLLMRDIRHAIGDGKILSQATVSSAKYIDLLAVNNYVDYTNVMTYDLGWAPYHNSPLYSSPNAPEMTADSSMMMHLRLGIPAGKLVMGLAFFGHAVKGFRPPRDLTKAHLADGYTACWDALAQVPYLADSTGTLAYGYENEMSLALKCEYIRKHGFKGAMFWSYEGDNESLDLCRTVFMTVNKGDTPPPPVPREKRPKF